MSVNVKESERCWEINYHLPMRVQKVAKEFGIPCTVFSSEYVFNGLCKNQYTEDDDVNPITIYGMTKAKLEEKTLEEYPENTVFRISKLADLNDRRTFLSRMREEMIKKRVYRAANDQYFSPIDLQDSVRIIEMAHKNSIHGLYNLCGDTMYSRYDIAAIINKGIQGKCIIDKCSLSDITCSYTIPANLTMSPRKIKEKLMIKDLVLSYC